MNEQIESVLTKIANRVKEVEWELKGSLIRVAETNQCPLEFIMDLDAGALRCKAAADVLSVDRATVIMIAAAADGYFSCNEEGVKEVNRRLLEMTGLKDTHYTYKD